MRKKPSGGEPQVIKIPPMDIRGIKVKIVGDSLITNRYDPDDFDHVVKSGDGSAQLPRRPKTPEQAAKASCHLMPGSTWADKKPRLGFPAVAFKSAMVQAANDMGITQVLAKRAFMVMGGDGGLVELSFVELRFRTDPAKTATGGPLVRHRGNFIEWRATLDIDYNASNISAEQVVAICEAAGFGVGVGAWRISGKKSTGTHGGWKVEKKAG